MESFFFIFISISPLVVIYKMLKTKKEVLPQCAKKNEEQFYLRMTLIPI